MKSSHAIPAVQKPAYPRLLFIYKDADGITQAFAINGTLAYFPNDLDKPAASASDADLTSYLNGYLAQNTAAKPNSYVEKIVRHETPYVDYLEVHLTGLGTSGVRNVYGINNHRELPTYTTFSPTKAESASVLRWLANDMLTALHHSKLTHASQYGKQ